MSQRYFLTAESTYEALRQSLNTALAYPNSLGKSVFQTALYAPRDTFRRVLLAVDTDLPGYSTISSSIAPLLDSDAMEEIDQATYLAALATASAGGGASDFSSVTDTLTYTNFLPEGGSLATALSGIDSALGGKALASDFDQGLKTTDSVSFYQVTVNPQGSGNPGIFYTGAGGSVGGALIYAEANDQFSSINLGSAGQALVVNSGGTLPQWKTLAAADIGAASSSHAHSASDVTSGTFDIARIPTGTTSTTVCIGNDARLSDARTPTAHNHAASDINSGVLATARLASSGTASATTFLRGDQTWASAGSTSASDLTSGTLGFQRLPARVRSATSLYLWSAFR